MQFSASLDHLPPQMLVLTSTLPAAPRMETNSWTRDEARPCSSPRANHVLAGPV